MVKTGQSYAAAKASLVTQRDRLRERSAEVLAGADPRHRAAADLSRLVDHIRDAVDGALAVGLNWHEISNRLGLDPELVQMWIHQE
jgi:hypothetical protein